METREKAGGKSIVAIVIGAALFFVLGRYVSIPSPVPNTTINIQYGVLGIFSAIYGPVAGMFGGLIGHTLIDLSWGEPWWSWIAASAVYGVITGLSKKKLPVQKGVFGTREMLIFNVFQVLGHVVSWMLVAPVLDLILYGEPIEKLFAQGITAAVGNSISTAITATILLTAYAKTRTEEEDPWDEGQEEEFRRKKISR